MMSPLDRIILIIREDAMIANSPGQGGAFSGNSEASGPTAGYDNLMGLVRRKSGLIDRRTRAYKKQYDSWLRSSGLL